MSRELPPDNVGCDLEPYLGLTIAVYRRVAAVYPI